MDVAGRRKQQYEPGPLMIKLKIGPTIYRVKIQHLADCAD